MTHIYLHIGLNKTGTSSVQNSILQNREYLRSQGVVYPDAWQRDGAHHELAGMDNSPNALIKNDVRFQQLFEEISGYDKAIISSEALFNSEKLDVICHMLSDFKVTVILYLRHHVPHLVSWFQQDVQQSVCTANPLDYIFYQKKSYVWLVRKIHNVFGRENVVLRPYDRAYLKNGDSIDDFFDVCDINIAPPFKRSGWENNPSISGNLLFYKRLANFFISHEDAAQYTSQVFELSKLDPTFKGGVTIESRYLKYWNSMLISDVVRLRTEFGLDLGEQPAEIKGNPSPAWGRWKEDFDQIVEASKSFGLDLHKFVPQIRNLAPVS